MIELGSQELSNLYYGTQSVISVFQGTQSVWPLPVSGATITYVGRTQSLSSTSTYTFTNLNLGNPGPLVIVIQSEAGGVSPRSITNVTLNGVILPGLSQSTTINTTLVINGMNTASQSSTTGTVSVTFNGSVNRASVAIYNLSGVRSAIWDNFAEASKSSGTTNSITFGGILATQSKSVGIISLTNGLDTSGPVTFTNATSVYDISTNTGGTRMVGATFAFNQTASYIVSASHSNSAQPIAMLGMRWSY